MEKINLGEIAFTAEDFKEIGAGNLRFSYATCAEVAKRANRILAEKLGRAEEIAIDTEGHLWRHEKHIVPGAKLSGRLVCVEKIK